MIITLTPQEDADMLRREVAFQHWSRAISAHFDDEITDNATYLAWMERDFGDANARAETMREVYEVRGFCVELSDMLNAHMLMLGEYKAIRRRFEESFAFLRDTIGSMPEPNADRGTARLRRLRAFGKKYGFL